MADARRWRIARVGPDDPELLRVSPVITEALAQSTAVGDMPSTVLMRRQTPYVLLGPKDRRLPDLDAGVDFLRRQGLRVFERISGGSAVYLDETCLSFGVMRPGRDLTALKRNYHELGEGVRAALQAMGVPARFGAAAGSYCEGPYDLVAGGQKIAGVAQAIRRGYALVSGMILVRQDPAESTGLLAGFYKAAGGSDALRADAVTNLEALLARPVEIDEVEAVLQHTFASLYALEEIPPTAAEIERSKALVSRRRLA